MPDHTVDGTGGHPVCIHTKQITDCCLDKDCIEDLRVYLTRSGQTALDSATGVKIRSAEVVFTQVEVEPLAYKTGWYAVDLTFYYRIEGEALQGAGRPTAISGIATFNKRAVLYGGTVQAKTFRSDMIRSETEEPSYLDVPLAVVEVLEPMILASRIKEAGSCGQKESREFPASLNALVGEELTAGGESRQLFVTIGQFSTLRLERDTQLTIPACRYCAPTKECCDGEECEEDPCQVFSQVDFPMDAFFPESEGKCS